MSFSFETKVIPLYSGHLFLADTCLLTVISPKQYDGMDDFAKRGS